MVKQNATGAKDVVALAVVHRHPVSIKFGYAVGTAGIKGRALNLRNGLHLAKHFGGGRLIEANLRVDEADGFQQIDGT